MPDSIPEIARRIRELREICDVSLEEIANEVELSIDEYKEYEAGNRDLPIGFLCKVAGRFGVDVIELLTGRNAKLHVFAVTRKNDGIAVSRNPQYKYKELAHKFRHKKIEPFIVTIEPDDKPVVLNAHTGHEFDFLIEGSIAMTIEDHEVVLNEGDSIYLDSSHMHGFKVLDEKPAKFLAIVMD